MRQRALVYYYAHKEKCLAYGKQRRREHGVLPHTPAMTIAERLAAIIMCRTCERQVTTPALLKQRRHKCLRCIKRDIRQREREQGVAGKSMRRYRASPTGALAKFKAWKATQKCSKCSYSGDPQRLHFHHRDPSQKVFKITRMVYRYGAKKLWEEIAKCDLLCEACHEGVHGVTRIRS